MDNSSHYDGRAIDVFFRPFGNAAQTRRGWVFAQWLAAHADGYDVLSVIYADRIWTSWASYRGLADYVHPAGNRTQPDPAPPRPRARRGRERPPDLRR